MYIYKAGVVGAGKMGAQIAQVITYSGLPVVLKDIDEDRTKKGLDTIREIYQSRVDKGKMTPAEMEQKLLLTASTTDYNDFRDVDIVIEAVFEDIDVKRDIFKELDKVCPEGTILATNTSSLSISAIGRATKRPDKVIGMHFFNPAHVMKLVEVIPGLSTSYETVDDLVNFSESLRKIPIRVQECAGFLVNRLLMPYLNEAAFALQEGASTAKEIDDEMVSFGMPMGPFTLCDMIGIDISARVAKILYDSYGDRMRVAEILSEMVKADILGTKSGKGFYNYEEGKKDILPNIIDKIKKEKGDKKSYFSPDRLLLAMINEAVICLQEGVSSAGDIDIAMMAGTGFPQERGGPLHYADQKGIDVILEELERYRKELGNRFWPAPMLKRMKDAGHTGVKAGKGFFDY
ncbi:MAG: 3-hydroxyacyl-CoA dehydrogenase [Nitrospirota bacterium]